MIFHYRAVGAARAIIERCASDGEIFETGDGFDVASEEAVFAGGRERHTLRRRGDL